MSFYWLRNAQYPRSSGWYTDERKWFLPGTHCPLCNGTGGATANAFPSVDLSHLPAQEQKKYSARVEQDFAEFERLREQVRPLVPPGVPLLPGTGLGPMTGSAQGEFGPVVLVNPWELLMSPEALQRLQAERLSGLKGCRAQLRFRKKNPPELLEMELLPRGDFHPDCLPEDPPPRCPKCGQSSRDRPEEPVLDAATLPQDLDLFRLAGFSSMLIATERFVEAVRRLGYEQDIAFRELPVH